MDPVSDNYQKIRIHTNKPINTIFIPNITAINTKVFISYINSVLNYNSVILFMKVNEFISEIHTKVINTRQYNEYHKIEWEKSLNHLVSSLEKDFEKILPGGERGFKAVTKKSQYYQEIENKLLNLEPIKIVEYKENQIVEAKDYANVETLVTEIKSEVKKGNRVSFKLLQELQSTLEEISLYAAEKEKNLIDDDLTSYKTKNYKYLQVAIQAVDAMDLIYSSAKKSDLNDWAPQIETIINNFLNVLLEDGIEELNVENAYFNGETMISIGNVPPETAPHLEKFQVYSVLERGFRNNLNGKLIREAKVITIY